MFRNIIFYLFFVIQGIGLGSSIGNFYLAGAQWWKWVFLILAAIVNWFCLFSLYWRCVVGELNEINK